MIAALLGPRRSHQDRRPVRAAAGLLLVVAVLAAGEFIVSYSLGGGSPAVVVTALVSQAGDALQPGDEVRYLDVVVGSVAGGSEAPGGMLQLSLRLQPEEAPLIPDAVKARSMPTSIFGAQYLQLVRPAPGAGSTHLVAGARIDADTSPGTAELQNAFTHLQRLLNAVHPARLDAALTALATALAGNGETLGKLIDNFDAYLRQVAPSTPQLQDDITQLAAVLEELNRDAPDGLRTLGNLITTSQTITDEQVQLRGLIGGGLTLTDDATELTAQDASRLIAVINDFQPVLAAVDRNTGGITNGVPALDAWFRSWTSTLSQGPYARINLLVPGVNGPALIAASLGGPTGKPSADQAFAPDLNPAPYTAADCPRYPGAAGANCPAAAQATSASAGAGGSVGPVGSAAEITTIQRLLGKLGGVAPNQVPPISDLLVGPLLRGAVVGLM